MKYIYVFCVLVLLLYGLTTVSGRRKLIKKPRPTSKPKRPKTTDDPSSVPEGGIGPGGRISPVRREGCSAPEVLVNGSALLGSGGRGDGRNEFATVHEVQFLGILGPEEQKRICKIRCLDGVWVGPFCTIDEGGDRFQKVLKRCTVRLTDAEVIGRTKDGKVLPVDSEVSMPHGSELHLKCVEPGMYKFVGNSSIKCDDGEWTSDLPHCEATTMQRNFSLEAPPTILYHVASGDAGLTERGSVVVFPGSIINFDCLFQRQFGNPEWIWTPTHRQYPSAWALSADEKSWKYRLSVYYAKDHDSGVFTCITPHGQSNDITMEVKDVHCPALQSVDHNRVMAVEGNKMHSKARFACMEGYILVGPEEITCQASGQWSEPAPHCEVISCPTLDPDSAHLHMSTRNKTYGTKVYFSCAMGFKLVGPPQSSCLKTGNWSEKLPTCKPITCKPPLTPLNGRVLDTGRYLSGDYVQYTCNAGHVLVGESVSICNDHGVWTQPPPLCKPACEFPGEPSNGHVMPTKFHYDIGEVVVVGCDSGYRLLGFQRLRCTSSSHWSSPLPHCRPYLATR